MTWGIPPIAFEDLEGENAGHEDAEDNEDRDQDRDEE